MRAGSAGDAYGDFKSPSLIELIIIKYDLKKWPETRCAGK